MLPVEFTVEGPPISYQSHNRGRLRVWQQTVAREARRVWAGLPLPDTVFCQITILYCYLDRPVQLDNDNLAKPIQDALNGLIWADDRQVTDTIIQLVRLHSRLSVEDSLALAVGVTSGQEFVYIRVEDAPSHERLP
jgi:crossover junction endodeoxyribonuclease RusA